VVSGKGWEEIPPDLRKQAETPWFQSFLSFDPARVIKDAHQPILVLHGDLDRQAAVHHADKLVELAHARKGRRVEVEKLPGLNHLLVPATSGDVTEYPDLKEKSVNASAIAAIARWFTDTLPAKR
jgi:fermentation-respiration switch protein FrsA (DUF1100 family)